MKYQSANNEKKSAKTKDYRAIMPTYEQLMKVAQVCHSLSEMKQEILLFLYEEETSEFFILAGKKAIIEVTIFPNTEVRVEIGDEV